MKRYRIRVEVIYSDIVEIDAESFEEAEAIAPSLACTSYDRLHDVELVSEKEIT